MYKLYSYFQPSIQTSKHKRIQGKKGLNGESDLDFFNVSSFANRFLEIHIKKLNFSFRQGII